jgi:prepilin-type N-terminal cleavage/methylation domain-containing protein
MKPANPNRLFQREGLSLVELLMAMTLLALISMAGLKGGDSGKVAHLIWLSAIRTISKFRLAWFKRKK